MTEEKPQKHRVVSRAEYLWHRLKKAGLSVWSILLFLFMLFFGVMALGVVFDLLHGPKWYKGILVAVGGCNALHALCKSGIKTMRKVRDMPAVLPLTRSVADQLPPEESLVRGSTEPSQAPDTLLRAARAEETPLEQLLRSGQQPRNS